MPELSWEEEFNTLVAEFVDSAGTRLGSLRDALLGGLQVARGDELGVHEVLDRATAKITNIFAREDHGLMVRIAHGAAVCTPGLPAAGRYGIRRARRQPH